MNEDLLDYYHRELHYLRNEGNDFSYAHPRTAGRLRLGDVGSDDPHVERLLQGFAFLTARMQQKLDDEFPQIAEAMLDALHPRLLNTIPSMTVVRFSLDNTAGKLTKSYEIPKSAPLLTEAFGGEPCRFRTTYPVTLWPLQVTQGRLDGPPFDIQQMPRGTESYLRLRLRCQNPDITFCALPLDRLRFYLHGSAEYVHQLYELLFNETLAVRVAKGGQLVEPGGSKLPGLEQVGFSQQEHLLPRSQRTPPGFDILLDYFSFPQKFRFVEVRDLASSIAHCDQEEIELVFCFRTRREGIESSISKDTFQLGCTPAVNLFRQVAEPVRTNHQTQSYRVTPNSRNPGGTEVYSIDRVTMSSPGGKTEEVQPYYFSRPALVSSSPSVFWHASRKRGVRREGEPDPGVDTFLSLVDRQLDPRQPTDHVLNIETTCSNRDLTVRLPFGGGRPFLALDADFQLESGGPIASIDCLVHPTPPRRPRLKRGVLWKLISNFSLNHLSITGGERGAKALTELLGIYDVMAEHPQERFALDAIRSIESHPVTLRVAPAQAVDSVSGPWAAETSFRRGTEIHLTLDEERLPSSSGFLFGCVLEQFFALYSSINSFSRLILSTTQPREIRRWPPRSGSIPTR